MNWPLTQPEIMPLILTVNGCFEVIGALRLMWVATCLLTDSWIIYFGVVSSLSYFVFCAILFVSVILFVFL